MELQPAIEEAAEASEEAEEVATEVVAEEVAEEVQVVAVSVAEVRVMSGCHSPNLVDSSR